MVLVAMLLLFGSAWHQASTELRDRPERAMATVVRCVDDKNTRGIHGSTIDVVFTDRQGQRREAEGLEAIRNCLGQRESVEIAYATEAPEQAILASLAFLLLARFLFFLSASGIVYYTFFHKAQLILRVLFTAGAAGFLYLMV
jgi:hypothetical protein